MPNNLTTKVWYSTGMTYPWPEQAAGVKPNVGICLSGGGTRAMSAAMGQLRALIDIGFMKSIDYMSVVSGGSWAATAFAYYNTGASSDEEFLGPITDPKDITREGLDVMPESSLGWGATRDLGDAIDAAIIDGFKGDFIWAAAIGDLFFKRFGLWDNANKQYFSLDAATVAAIVAVNPSLATSPFVTVRQPSSYAMPYLLINGTMDGPTKGTPYSPDPMVMVTYSPLYCGVPFQQTIEYQSKHLKALGSGSTVTAVVGGGFIEPFAWNGGSPTAPASNGTVVVAPSAAPFGLVNASGTSSSAFAGIAEKIKGIDHLLPEQNYWPPMATGTQQPSESFDFGDGGLLENYGIIPLVMRGVQKIAVFINTEVKLNVSYDPTTTPTGKDIDLSLPWLFGMATEDSPPNQIFPTADFATLVRALQAKKNAGQPLVARMTHDVLPNPWWGVPGGGPVEVVWFYLDEVNSWKSQIGSDEVRFQLDLGDVGEFAHFPNYKTIDENPLVPWSLTQLTARQVNLLADLTCWVVRQSQGELEALLTSSA